MTTAVWLTLWASLSVCLYKCSHSHSVQREVQSEKWTHRIANGSEWMNANSAIGGGCGFDCQKTIHLPSATSAFAPVSAAKEEGRPRLRHRTGRQRQKQNWQTDRTLADIKQSKWRNKWPPLRLHRRHRRHQNCNFMQILDSIQRSISTAATNRPKREKESEEP